MYLGLLRKLSFQITHSSAITSRLLVEIPNYDLLQPELKVHLKCGVLTRPVESSA